jgi:hypothetical protein
MGNDIRKKVDFPLYLEVLKQLPEVSEQDIAQTKKVFEEIYGEVPDEVTFDIGAKKGDGEIFAFQRITDEAGRSYRTKLYINEYGELENKETGYTGSIPWNVSKYLTASLFGVDELAKAEFLPELKIAHYNVFGGCIDMKDDFDPYWEDGECSHHVAFKYLQQQMNALITPHLADLSEGAWLLYKAAEKKGAIGATANSEGTKQIDGVKAQLMAKMEILTQEVWEDAEEIKKGSNKKDGVKAAMEQYAEFKPGSPALTYNQAMERYEAAIKMIKEVATADKYGFKRECCDEAAYKENYKCGYGVNGGINSIPKLQAPVAGSKS